jgi:hypothetical protein
VQPGAADPELAALHHWRAAGLDYDAVSYRLRHDSQFRLEMMAAAKYQIPHSQFIRWSDADRAYAIGYALFEGARCSKCGTHPDDWGAELEEDPPAEVELGRCYGCQAVETHWAAVQERAKDQGGARALAGVTPHLVRKDNLAAWLGQIEGAG